MHTSSTNTQKPSKTFALKLALFSQFESLDWSPNQTLHHPSTPTSAPQFDGSRSSITTPGTGTHFPRRFRSAKGPRAGSAAPICRKSRASSSRPRPRRKEHPKPPEKELNKKQRKHVQTLPAQTLQELLLLPRLGRFRVFCSLADGSLYTIFIIDLRREGTKAGLRKKISIWSTGVNARAQGKRWKA